MAKTTSEPKPERLHRRPTEDQMRAALARVEAVRSQLHTNPDDEHAEVLHDIVNELLQLRTINARLMQETNSALLVAQVAMKAMTLA